MLELTILLDSNESAAHIAPSVNGQQVRALRKTYDLTQTALAEMLDVPSSTVSKWESGTYRMTRRDALAVVHVINEYKRKLERKTA